MLRIYKLLESLDFKRETVGGRYKLGPYVRNDVAISIDPYKKTWAIAPCIQYPFKVFTNNMKPNQLTRARDNAWDAVGEAFAVASLLDADPNLWEDEDDD